MEEWLWGRNSVKEAFEAGQRCFFEILVLPGTRHRFGFLDKAVRKGAAVRDVDADKLLDISGGGQHQGIAARVSQKNYSSYPEVVSFAKKRQELPFLLILDGVCDPHNFGAILRTAEVAGVHGVVIPSRAAVGMTPTVSRVSAGGMEYMRVIREKNLVSFVKRLKKDDFWVAGLFADSEDEIFDIDLGCTPMALVVGGEERGIRPLLKENCDFALKIPRKGLVDSLNASVAASIGVYEVIRQRKMNLK